jgi:hypothetical protein
MIPDEMHFETRDDSDEFEKRLLEAMTKPLLDKSEPSMRVSGGLHTWTWTNLDRAVEEIVEEKLMAKKVSAHAKPEFTDGVWVCNVCNSESMDKEMFEEAGVWEECAKNAAELVGEEKTALGRYVAGAEAKQNLDRATAAIKEFKAGMEKLGLAAADLSLMMQVTMGDFSKITPEDVTRLSRNFPELKDTLAAVEFPKSVTEELKPLAKKEWHKNLMRTLDNHYTWDYVTSYTVVDRVVDFIDDAMDFILRRY